MRGTETSVSIFDFYYLASDMIADIYTGDWVGLEVPSRVLTLSSPEWRQEILAILSALVGGPGKGLHSAYIDSECGTHIHVGNNGAFFPLPVLQNLACPLLIYEAQISKMHFREPELEH
jgi:hypothetical protein